MVLYQNISQVVRNIKLLSKQEVIPLDLVREVIIDHIDATIEDEISCREENRCKYNLMITRNRYQVNPECIHDIHSEISRRYSIRKASRSGERQAHGFTNELRVVKKCNLIHMKSDYTAKWDAYTKESMTPVSIKFKQHGGSIEIADFFRQSQIKNDFYLHVSFWEGPNKNITSEHMLLIPGSVWSSFFTDIYDDEIKRLLQEASNDPSYDKIWKDKCKELQAKWDSFGSIIKLAPKRDHKRQKRMQCVIPYKYFMILVEEYAVDAML